MSKKIIIDIDSGSEVYPLSNKKENDENSMSNLSVVKNVEVSIEDNKMLIEVDLSHDFGKTKRGKTQIATTRGNKFYTLDDSLGLGCALSLTVYKN